MGKKKMSQTTREIIKTAIVLVVIGLLAVVYIVYPLMKTSAVMGRPDMDAFNEPDSIPANDPSACLETGLACDTFRVESDGLTSLAGLLLPARTDTTGTPRGTVILLHHDTTSRTALFPWALQFVDSGYNVVLYDQRASGYSTSRYHGEGWYEASDLEEVISYLDIHGWLKRPLVVIGQGVGGDAAYLASLEESRIDAIAAINPYLSTSRMWSVKQDGYDLWSFPFFKTMMWWWYNIRSSYAAPYRDVSDLEAVPRPTLLFVPTEALDSEEVTTLRDLSEEQLLSVKTATSEGQLLGELFRFITTVRPGQTGG